jgi:osmoprotectant transport system permease protein
MTKKIIPGRVELTALLISLSGLFINSFLLHKANRLVEGAKIASDAVIPSYVLVTMIIALSVTTLSLRFRAERVLKAAILSASFLSVLFYCGKFADSILSESPYARVSFSTGFWVFILGLYLFFTLLITKIESKNEKAVIGLIFFAPVLIIFMTGFMDNMSVMREYINYSDRFLPEIANHLVLSCGSVFLACVAGIPMGIFAFRHRKTGEKIFNILNILQTIPSIALFGLLMIPLAWLVKHLTFLEKLGISGIGWTPAVIALFMYSLLPVVRNTYEGLDSIDTSVIEAGKGVGMTKKQILRQIEIPLSLPVVLNGIRVALVQSIGNTAVASLIGAGGMGLFIFQGLGQSAVDLIILGAVPTIIMAILADSIMQTINGFIKRVDI